MRVTGKKLVPSEELGDVSVCAIMRLKLHSDFSRESLIWKIVNSSSRLES